MHNFIIANSDTDANMFYKPGFEPFPKEERVLLLKELNDQFPEGLVWEDDGYFPCVCVLRAKNYILYDGKKIKIKGSGLKSSKIEDAFKEFLNEVIDAIVFDKGNYTDIYHKYIREINNIQDIRRYSSKKTVTSKVEDGTGTTQVKMREAIKDAGLSAGSKFWCFFDEDDSLVLAENFKGTYNKNKLYKKLHKCAAIFDLVMDHKAVFPDYSLKNKLTKAALEEVLK